MFGAIQLRLPIPVIIILCHMTINVNLPAELMRRAMKFRMEDFVLPENLVVMALAPVPKSVVVVFAILTKNRIVLLLAGILTKRVCVMEQALPVGSSIPIQATATVFITVL